MTRTVFDIVQHWSHEAYLYLIGLVENSHHDLESDTYSEDFLRARSSYTVDSVGGPWIAWYCKYLPKLSEEVLVSKRKQFGSRLT